MDSIVVGLDGSPRAPGVLRAAADLAKRTGAALLAVRAVGIPPELPLEAMTAAPDGLPAQLLAVTQQSLERLVAESPERASVALAVTRIGTPWQVLCDTAREHHATLLVVGTHGYGALDRVLGTTAARVVNHAPCSVLVVREGAAP
jgi:universal stress protein F